MEREHITLNSIKNSDAIADQELRNILQIMQNRNTIVSQFDGQNLQAEMQKAVADQNKDEAKAKLEELAEGYALTLLSQDPAMAQATLERMKNDMPNLHNLVMQKIRDFHPNPPNQKEQAKEQAPPPPVQQIAEPGGDDQKKMPEEKPLPENSMPRRAGAV